MYGGPFNDMIIRLSRNSNFTQIWGIPSYTNSDPNKYYEESARQQNALYRIMADCQIVLRFFALEKDEFIQGSMRAILDRCMERYVDAAPEVVADLEERYISRLDFAYKLFDGRPFELSLADDGRSRPSVAIYDGVMGALDRNWARRDKILSGKEKIQAAYRDLVSSEARTGSLTGAANTSLDVKSRIERLSALMRRA